MDEKKNNVNRPVSSAVKKGKKDKYYLNEAKKLYQQELMNYYYCNRIQKGFLLA